MLPRDVPVGVPHNRAGIALAVLTALAPAPGCGLLGLYEDGTGGGNAPAFDGSAGSGATGGTAGDGGVSTGSDAMGGASGGISGTGGSSGVGAVGGGSGTGGQAGTGGAGGSGGSAGMAGCPAGLPGPVLVQVPAPNGESYCMDATEVTNGDYAEYLATSPSTSSQASACSWNTTYVPSSGWPATGRNAYPVVYVDWCDAYAYCEWAGKRLCGRIGGGANPFAAFADAMQSQWYSACSKSGTQAYPYGGTYQASTCVGSGYDGILDFQSVSDVARPAGSVVDCEGGYPGLFDLSGNVWEWEDSCNGNSGTQDRCFYRSGSFVTVITSRLGCGYAGAEYRNVSYDDVGFRCCSS